MHHFKRPIIVTGIAVLVAIIAGVIGVTMIYRAKIPDREKKARVEMLGGGAGFAVILISFPFWILAADKVGKERRAAREAEKQAKEGRESN